MEIAVWISLAVFLVTSSVVGGRLLLLSSRTGQLPELLIGVGILGIGPLGLGLSMLAWLPGRSTILGVTLVGCSFLALFIGAASQYVFTWYVFHQGDRWARPACVVAVLLLASAYAGDILENGLINRDRGGFWFWLGTSLRAGVLGWVATEAFVYWLRMKRRLRLGLADPVVTNRFLLWSLGSAFAFLGSSIGAGVIAATGFGSRLIPALALVLCAHGLLAAVAMWLAFLPPPRYRRWIERRSQRSRATVSSRFP
ncbi:MAG: hypothetical protein ACR2P8_08050 [Myxococcota bacterium]